MFAIVAINFEAFQALPPFEFKLMAAVLRYVNRQGECCPALTSLPPMSSPPRPRCRGLWRGWRSAAALRASARATADTCTDRRAFPGRAESVASQQSRRRASVGNLPRVGR